MIVEKELSYAIVGCALQIHNELGYGFHESVYMRALAVALERRGLRVRREVPVKVYFWGVEVGSHRLDLLVEERIVVEGKSMERVPQSFQKQVRSYLAATGLELGLLINFGESVETTRILGPRRPGGRKAPKYSSPNTVDFNSPNSGNSGDSDVPLVRGTNPPNVQSQRLDRARMAIEIRTPRPSDVGEIAELLTQLGYPTRPGEVLPRLRRFAEQPKAIMWAAEQDGQVAGLATAHVITSLHKSEPVAMLTVLVVHERARGRGIGAQLVATAEAWAREQGATAISLTSANRRLEAHEFYKRLGYEQTGVRLAKSLT